MKLLKLIIAIQLVLGLPKLPGISRLYKLAVLIVEVDVRQRQDRASALYWRIKNGGYEGGSPASPDSCSHSCAQHYERGGAGLNT